MSLFDANDLPPTRDGRRAPPSPVPAASPPPTASPAAPVAEAERGVALSELLGRVEAAVTAGVPGRHWVRCEVSECKLAQSGHVYLKLQETDRRTGARLCQVSATLWSRTRASVLPRFEAVAGRPLGPGILILVQLSVQCRVEYGLSVQVHDIDPEWTLGDAARKLEELRARIRADGLWDLNRRLAAPTDFTSVAVLAPEGSAGLDDFMRETVRLEAAGVCRFEVTALPFEGPRAAARLAEAVWEIAFDAPRYDALCVVRGGGAASSLAWLDSDPLARAVCDCPIPVVTGIGHEKDSTLVDEVAHTRCGTPSKAIQHVTQRIVAASEETAAAWSRVGTLAGTLLDGASADVDRALADVARRAAQGVDDADAAVDQAVRDVRLWAGRSLDVAASELDAAFLAVVAMGPTASAARGFPAASSAGALVRSAAQARAAGTIDLWFEDGRVPVKVSAPRKPRSPKP